MDYRISKLHNIFCESGICDEAGLTVEELHQISAPNELKEMLKLSKEWHLQKDHYNVFGMNLFDKDSVWINKERIIGDVELVEQWKEEHDSPNCAEEGWQCFAVFSEYDFLFVQTNPGENFGATRHMVNNCWEDSSLTSAPFSNFFEGLAKYTEAFNKRSELASEEDLEDEELHVLSFFGDM